MAVQNISLDNFQREIKLHVDQTELSGYVSKQNVANFLGIPFAQVPARFRTARKIDLTDLHGSVDATQYGPRCPQKVDTIHPVMAHVFEKLSISQRCDEDACLHLNIYAPLDAIEAPNRERIPVFAWIHGGGFSNGDNTTEFDGNHLVQRSVELGTPIIIVTINYRLNLFGFSASQELIEEAKSLGEIPVMNQGLNDQRLGLQWIQTSIYHFGGDSSKVTLSGESAGAASVLLQIHGGQPLFSQALIQSAPVPRLRNLTDGQASFDKLATAAEIPVNAPGAEKLEALRALSSDEILSFNEEILTPVEDSAWFAPYVSSESTDFWGQLPEWCSRVIVGYLKDEAALFFIPLFNSTEVELLDFVQSIAPNVPGEIFSDGKPSLEKLIAWVTEDAFTRPAIELASQAGKHSHNSVHLYTINLVDPFPGPLYAYAWHSLGVSLTFCQPPGRVWPQIRATQERMSAAFINFIYGLEPWEPLNVAKRQMSFNGEESGLISVQSSEDVDNESLLTRDKNLGLHLFFVDYLNQTHKNDTPAMIALGSTCFDHIVRKKFPTL